MRCNSRLRTFDINTLWTRQNGRYFADDIFKCIFLKENIWIFIKISLKFFSKGPFNNIPALVHIMNQWWLVYSGIYTSLRLNMLRWSCFHSNLLYRLGNDASESRYNKMQTLQFVCILVAIMLTDIEKGCNLEIMCWIEIFNISFSKWQTNSSSQSWFSYFLHKEDFGE